MVEAAQKADLSTDLSSEGCVLYLAFLNDLDGDLALRQLMNPD